MPGADDIALLAALVETVAVPGASAGSVLVGLVSSTDGVAAMEVAFEGVLVDAVVGEPLLLLGFVGSGVGLAMVDAVTGTATERTTAPLLAVALPPVVVCEVVPEVFVAEVVTGVDVGAELVAAPAAGREDAMLVEVEAF